MGRDWKGQRVKEPIVWGVVSERKDAPRLARGMAKKQVN